MNRLLSLTATVLWHDLLRTSRRAGRYEYLWGIAISCLIYPLVVQLIVTIATLALVGLDGLAFRGTAPASGMPLGIMVFGALQLAVTLHAFLVFVTLAVRRLHDLGLHGWVLLVMFAVTFLVGAASYSILGIQMHALQWHPVGLAVSLVLYLALGIPKGSQNPNRWGERPATWPPD